MSTTTEATPPPPDVARPSTGGEPAAPPDPYLRGTDETVLLDLRELRAQQAAEAAGRAGIGPGGAGSAVGAIGTVGTVGAVGGPAAARPTPARARNWRRTRARTAAKPCSTRTAAPRSRWSGSARSATTCASRWPRS
ncbi:hypothetical protein ACFQ9X_01160 [Catenulispora yoronensis]